VKYLEVLIDRFKGAFSGFLLGNRRMNELIYCSVTKLPRREAFLHEMRRVNTFTLDKRLLSKKCIPAIVFFDLNRLKYINDELGYQVGDKILENFSEVLKLFFRRREDRLTRFGGDEFIVGILDCPGFESVQFIANQVKIRFESILTNHLFIKILSDEFNIGEEKLNKVLIRSGVSFGIYVLPHAGLFELDHAIRLADQQLSQAKIRDHEEKEESRINT